MRGDLKAFTDVPDFGYPKELVSRHGQKVIESGRISAFYVPA